MKFFELESVRFMVAGVFNTLIGYVVYLFLLLALPYLVAYTGAYLFGIVFSYGLNTYFVFRQHWHWGKFFAYPVVYLLQYGFGVMAMYLLVSEARIDSRLAPLVVVVLTVPLTFFASRIVIKGSWARTR